ncbi:MAG: GTPase HflX [Bdellovibrionaceae bacterium]|nr:GTPase HflX [Pseudobdellovibrionaceae bacterium]
MSSNSNPLNNDRAIIIGTGLKKDSLVEIKESLVELEDLVFAAGGEVVGSFVQVLEKYNAATLLGTGKVEEVKELVSDTEAQLVVIDHELSGVQSRNLEQAWQCRVLDRTQLILDIFALRAKTYEGKLQVELAQLMDQLPRMRGGWLGSLSRQGGGIGTRGPGETALEIDRRRARERVKIIKNKLEQVRSHREQHRSQRKKNQVPSFALIGYTNAGKSTLLNKLTNANVFVKAQAFATLDPTTRKLHLEGFGHVLLTDTVGFIRKLPTHLIEAFKATLEESGDADVLVHVIDLSNDQMEKQIQTVQDLIDELGWNEKPIIYVYNKVDAASPERQFKVKYHPKVFISAMTGEGIAKFKDMLRETLHSLTQEVELFIPKDQEQIIYEIGRTSKITSQEPNSRGVVCRVKMTDSELHKWSHYLIND